MVSALRFLMAAVCAAPLCDARAQVSPDPVVYVDPFIGTAAHGHTFPGATVPFGMVQLSPDTRLEGWDGCSGYHYTDRRIYGFSHTHLSGTGVPDYCDVLLAPYVGRPDFAPEVYASGFQKNNEVAEAGYYRVHLDREDVLAELTATARTGVHRYTFPKDASLCGMLIDLRHRDPVIKASLTAINDRVLVGYRISTSWAKEQRVYFAMRFSKPFLYAKMRDMDKSETAFMQSATGRSILGTVDFATDGDPLVVTVGLSGTSVEGALQNLQDEAPHFDFDRYRAAARSAWVKALSKIEVDGGTEVQKRVFYTALYHTMIAPNLFNDVTGLYRGHDGEHHLAKGHDVYTVFSLWDTYRACKPLYTLLEARRMNDFIQSFLRQYEQTGLLPVWELAGNETNCMIGYHSVPVIADAWRKGIRGYDGRLALKAMVASATQDKWGQDHYRSLGYIPSDQEGESVSKTLEYAFDDWTIAQMAKMLGEQDIWETFTKRSQYWKNIFDPATGFFRAKINSTWYAPFDPLEVNFHYTEANAWQYRFGAPHDISTQMAWMGGSVPFAKALDNLFNAPSRTTGREQSDITGLIGQYAHGNEPSHHMAYLYNIAGQPWKTQQRVRQIMDELYSDKPDGLCGNEDVGQMSAWLVFSAMGFYPVVPASNSYVVGTPWFEKMVLNLEDGKRLDISAPGVSKKRFYVRGLRYNDNDWVKGYILHDMLARGGKLQFDMSDKPTSWATDSLDWPVYAVTDFPIVAVPFVRQGETVFRDSQWIDLGTPDPESVIHYTLDGSDPEATGAPIYTAPLRVEDDTRLRMVARKHMSSSKAVEANFYRLRHNLRVHRYNHPFTPPYTGGGQDGLIDQRRGGADFRSGHWQGFQGVDLDIVIDLGTSKPVQRVAVGFLQDENAWIFYPSRLRVELSNDGVQFVPYGATENAVPVMQPGVLRQDLLVTADLKQARYVRVIGENMKTCPPSHKGAGYPCWVFADEITVE